MGRQQPGIAPQCDGNPPLLRQRQATACWSLRRDWQPARTSGSRRSRLRLRGPPGCWPPDPPPVVLRHRQQQPSFLSEPGPALRRGLSSRSMAVPGVASACFAAQHAAALAPLAVDSRMSHPVRSSFGPRPAAADRARLSWGSGAARPAWRGSVAPDALDRCLVRGTDARSGAWLQALYHIIMMSSDASAGTTAWQERSMTTAWRACERCIRCELQPPTMLYIKL